MSTVSMAQSDLIIERLMDWLILCNNSILLEQLNESGPCLTCFREPDAITKTGFDVAGGYTVQFPFTIYYKITSEELDQRLLATSILSEFIQYFETASSYPNIGEHDLISKIEAISHIGLANYKEDKDLYQLKCLMSYRHKQF